MRKVLLMLCLLFCSISNLIFAQYPTDSARVYLITASPGRQTYAAFGHSALRVVDPSKGYDYAYNWGTFDFDTENFYFKFGTGKLMYFLAINNFYNFVEYYHMVGQAIYLQEILLTNKEKSTLINNIEINYREENRSYRYDFFRDNCATRIRDIIVKSVDGKVVFDSSYVEKRESISHLFGVYLKNEPWNYFGLNLIMGKSTDSIASLTDYMYLPGHLQNMFASAKIADTNGTRNLTRTPVELFPSTIEVHKPKVLFTPVAICVFFFLVIAGLTVWEYRRKKYFKAVDVSLFLITGLLGLLITWLWGWSLHIYVHNNLHIIWASPLNLIAAVCLMICSKMKWTGYYFAAYALSVILFIMVSFFVVQEFHPASYFIMGAMIIRAGNLFLRQRSLQHPQ
jgi:drug/metabolite transporter superfamily protein YnfA